MSRDPADGGQLVPCEGLLLDMDGVLVESADTVERHWSSWAQRRGLPRQEVLALAHGAPVRTVIAQLAPSADVDEESEWLESLAFTDPGADVALPGARAILTQTLLPVAVVTSASSAVARHRLQRAGLPIPDRVVAADDVEHGKPHPEPYATAAQRIGRATSACVAVEDSPTGARAALAAGAVTVAVLVSHRTDQLHGVHHVIADLSALVVEDGGVRLTCTPLL